MKIFQFSKVSREFKWLIERYEWLIKLFLLVIDRCRVIVTRLDYEDPSLPSIDETVFNYLLARYKPKLEKF